MRSVVCAAASAMETRPYEMLCAILARHDAHWLAKGASNEPAGKGDGCEDDDEDPFGHGGALDEREEESARSAHEANPTDYHVNTLVLGSGVVHHTHETWLMRGITFCGKCGAWATTAPRLLPKECAKEPGRRAYELKRLIAGKEPIAEQHGQEIRRLPQYAHVPWGGARARISVRCCAPRTTSDCASAVEMAETNSVM